MEPQIRPHQLLQSTHMIAQLEKSKAEASSNGTIQSADRCHNVQSLDQPETLLRCHLSPEVQGTFLAVRAHIMEHHGGQPLRFECNECGLQTESPSLLRLHQIRNHTANTAKTAKPGNAEAARPAATGGKAMTGPTERFKKRLLHESPVVGPGYSSSNKEVKAMMQKIFHPSTQKTSPKGP